MKAFWIVLVVVIVLAGGAFALVKHNDNKKTTATSSSSMSNMNMPSTTSSSSTNSSTSSQTNAVTISNFAFSPADITVKKGTTVTWTNKDAIAHTVTENDGQDGPKSGDLSQGKSYSFTYNTAGTFKYHCSIHPEMLGTVTVTE